TSTHIILYNLTRHCTFLIPSTSSIYTLSLHDALPISNRGVMGIFLSYGLLLGTVGALLGSATGLSITHWINDVEKFISYLTGHEDRKSTRLNSSHQIISYAVFCLKKKKKNNDHTIH